MGNHKDIWTDAEILEALYLCEVQGQSRSQCARSMSEIRGSRITSSAVIGVIYRVNTLADAEEVATRDVAVSPQYRDGSCSLGWWRYGLEVRESLTNIQRAAFDLAAQIAADSRADA